MSNMTQSFSSIPSGYIPDEFLGEAYFTHAEYAGNPQLIIDEINSRVQNGNYSAGICLSLSYIIQYMAKLGQKNTDLWELQRRLFIHHSSKINRGIGLIETYKTLEAISEYHLRTNYNYALALLFASRSNPHMQTWAEIELANLLSSIKNTFYYEDEDTIFKTFRPRFYYMVQVGYNNTIKKIKSDQNIEDIIGLHLIHLFKTIFYKPTAYSINYLEDLFREDSTQFTERFPGEYQVFGSTPRSDLVNIEINRENYKDIILQNRYPFEFSLIDNLILQTRIFGQCNLVNYIEALNFNPADTAFIPERGADIEFNNAGNPIPALVFAYHFADESINAIEPLQFIFEIPGAPSILTVPPKMEPLNVEAFAWDNTPYYPDLEDPLTKQYFASFFKIVEKPIRTTESIINSQLDPNTVSYDFAKWFAFIHGVPSRWIDSLGFSILKSLTLRNKAIEKKRSTESAMLSLQDTLMPKFRHHVANRGWMPFRKTAFRHENAGIWTYEVEPNLYSQEQIRLNHSFLQENYTSARYMLITTALVCNTRLNPWEGIKEWHPLSTYKRGVIVRRGGKLWRKAVDGPSQPPEIPQSFWVVVGGSQSDAVFDSSIEYQGGSIVKHNGIYYMLTADRSIGIKPTTMIYHWAEVKEDPAISTSGVQEEFWTTHMFVTNSPEVATNSLLFRAGTAWRYPNYSRMGNPSYRFRTRNLARVNVYIALRGQRHFTNEPVIKDGYRSSVEFRVLNETQNKWVNAAFQWRE